MNDPPTLSPFPSFSANLGHKSVHNQRAQSIIKVRNFLPDAKADKADIFSQKRHSTARWQFFLAS